jgi:DNA invertase Pin-like site-specific DNA recombinase
MRRAAIYLRLSTQDQTTLNQERELQEVATRMSCNIVKVYRDQGVSRAKARDKRPQFDGMCKDAARRQFDIVMAWSAWTGLVDLCKTFWVFYRIFTRSK